MTVVGNRRYHGRYRGKVSVNIDPKQRGRLMVQVPDVLGEHCTVWAEPATPLAGTNMGLAFVPPLGSGVWVEFEQGDPNYAIWAGGWRGSDADLPAAANKAPPTNPPIVLQSQAQNQLVISSAPGEGITIETSAGPTGPRIEITPLGITLSTGKGASIELTGNIVKINNTSLTVTG